MKPPAVCILCILAIPLLLPARDTPLPYSSPLIETDVDRLNANKLDMPILNDGSTGNSGTAWYPRGQTEASILFEGGLCLSGYVGGDLRASWMAKASRIQEFQPGIWGMDPSDPIARNYLVSAEDGPGSDAYVEWIDAVATGAEFVDRNSDGLYDPWIDSPPQLGHKLHWCVYNDGEELEDRALGSLPLEVEIRQIAWAWEDYGPLADVILFHRRMTNVSSSPIDSLIFSSWQDVDLGWYADDLVGCDTLLDLGITYNLGDDTDFGSDPPAFGALLLQGGVVAAIDASATVYRGFSTGYETLPGATTLPMTAFSFYESTVGDPDNAQEARWWQVGGTHGKTGLPINPEWYGNGDIQEPRPDSMFVYAGNPLNPNGTSSTTDWLDTNGSDKRTVTHSGPFTLPAGETVDIVTAYVLGRGIDALSSVGVMKENTAYVRSFFQTGYTANIIVSDTLVSSDSLILCDAELLKLFADVEISTVQWQLLDKPDGSTAVINPSAGYTAKLDPDLEGYYTVHLAATTDLGTVAHDTLAIHAIDNHPPQAELVFSSTEFLYGDTVTVDASGLMDPDNDSLSFAWDMPDWLNPDREDSTSIQLRPWHVGSAEVAFELSDSSFTIRRTHEVVVSTAIEDLEVGGHSQHMNFLIMDRLYTVEGNLWGYDWEQRRFWLIDESILATTNALSLEGSGENLLFLDDLVIIYGDESIKIHRVAEENIEILSTIGIATHETSEIAFHENRLIVPGRYPDVGIRVYDISDPALPSPTSTFPQSALTFASAFGAETLAMHLWERGIHLLDISEPDSIAVLDSLELTGNVYMQLRQSGNMLYAVDNTGAGTTIHVIETVQGLEVVSTFNPGADVEQVYPVGDTLIIADRNGVSLWNLSDPLSPQEVAYRRSGNTIATAVWQDGVIHMIEEGELDFGAGYYQLVFETDSVPPPPLPEPVIPERFALHHNFPNPFNNATVIRYDLPYTLRVELTVYDLLGRRVRTLVDDLKDAGEHEISWDTADDAGQPAASGIYIYRLQAEGAGLTIDLAEKMVLLR